MNDIKSKSLLGQFRPFSCFVDGTLDDVVVVIASYQLFTVFSSDLFILFIDKLINAAHSSRYKAEANSTV